MIHGDVLGERARLSPRKLALVDVRSGARRTYSELDARAARLARAIRDNLGLRAGDRVGILSHNTPEFLDVFFAAGKSGIIVVPLGARLAPAELAAIARDADLAALFFDPDLVFVVLALKDALADVSLHWIAWGRRYDELLRGADDAPWDTRSDGPEIAPEHPYCLLYTSGTTGRPKGVILPHRMIAWNAIGTALGWQLRETDVSPIFTPLYHAGGLGVFLTSVFAIGGTIVLHRGFDPGEIGRTIATERCTVALGVPTIWQRLLDDPEFTASDLSSVRWFISGGAPLPRALIEAWAARGIVLRQGYGLTEVGVNCFAMDDGTALRKAGSIGRPLMWTRARVVAADGREAGAGEVGELWLTGPHVCAGYWNDPAATAAALDADGWFHTGDLASRDDEGDYAIVGRLKDMYISGGVNVYPAEVEAALAGHPSVAEAAVVGVPDARWGEAGVAFVVPADGAVPDEAALRAHLSALISPIKQPRDFVFVDDLPHTPYGKVIKSELDVRARRAAKRGGAPSSN